MQMERTMADKYRILSLDGGGIRGVLTAQLLKLIEERKPGFLASVDMFAGTSTGAILAAGLAKGLKPEEIIDLYIQDGQRIFPSWRRKLGYIGMLFSSRYGTSGRKEALENLLGDKTLGDVNRDLLISSFLLDSINDPNCKPESEIPVPDECKKKVRQWKAKFFHNLEPKRPSARDYRCENLVDVVTRSSAAPLYFPLFQNYVDGGIVANNPALCSFAQVISNDTPIAKQDEVVILSLGTGDVQKYITNKNSAWGLLGWKLQLIDILTSGSVGLATFQGKQILGDRFQRLNPILPKPIELDDASPQAIKELIEAANNTAKKEGNCPPELDATIDFITKQWM